eukprot:g2883.t1
MNEFTVDIHRVWQPVLTPDDIRILLFSRLANQFVQRLDVFDFKEFLDLRCLRFAERLFALIDINGEGLISVEAAVNFVHSFESQDLRSRVHLIFLCYDPVQSGSLTFAEIKTMIFENFVEGNYGFDHKTIEFLTEQLIKGHNVEDADLSEFSLTYPQLMDLASIHPECFAHLIKSKIPLRPHAKNLTDLCKTLIQNMVYAWMENLGRVILFGLLACVALASIASGLVTNQSGTRAEYFGIAHTLSQTASDLFKILFAFLFLTFCNIIPFLLRIFTDKVQLDYSDVVLLRKFVFVALLILCGIHSVSQIQNMRKLSNPKFIDTFSRVFRNNDQPRFYQLLKSNVFITGMFLIILTSLISALFVLEDLPIFVKNRRIMELRRAVITSRYMKSVCFILFGFLLAAHSTTTFLRDSFQIPSLLWLWLGAPMFILAVDHFIFAFYVPTHEVEIIGYRVWRKQGVLLVLQKPTDFQLWGANTISVRFPFISNTSFQEVPLLSYSNDDQHVTVFLPVNNHRSEDTNRFFYRLQTGNEELTGREEVEEGIVESQSARVEGTALSRVRRHRPRRLTRLNTRVVYLNHGTERDEASTSEPRQVTKRTGSNFNLIFEISPASGSSEETTSTEDRQPEIMPSVNEESEFVTDSRWTIPNRRLTAFVKGPYSRNKATAYDKAVEEMLLCETLFLMGSGTRSLSVIPLCKELLKRAPMTHSRVSRIVVSWEIAAFDDVAWFVEVMESLMQLRSSIEVEIKIHVGLTRQRRNLEMLSNSFLRVLGDLLVDRRTVKIPTQSKVDIQFGTRDCVYELVNLKGENSDRQIGVVFDGPFRMKNLVASWIKQINNVNQFQLFSSTW